MPRRLVTRLEGGLLPGQGDYRSRTRPTSVCSSNGLPLPVSLDA